MGAKYKYSGIMQSSEAIPEEMHDLLERLGEIADVDYSNLINRVAIVVNYYAGGEDNIGWHADDEPCIDQSYPIVSVSFGATRDFKIRKKADRKEVYTLPLADCDVLIMQPGMQEAYQHSLPKRKNIDSPRINITVRIVK
jgi:alkylated DNA repair dioxygenase AlkB